MFHSKLFVGKSLWVAPLAILASALACSAPVATTAQPSQATPATEAPATAAPAPASRHALIETAAFDLQTVGADGQSTPFGKAGVKLGGGPYYEFGVADGKLFAVSAGDASGPAKAYVIDGSGAQPLAFISQMPQGFAVWPGDGQQPGRIAWGEADYQEGPVPTEAGATPGGPMGMGVKSRLMVADATASSGKPAYQAASNQGLYAAPFRWTPDGKRLFYSMEPSGLGGYILFGGHSSLYSLDVASGQSTELIPPDIQHTTICLADLSPDFTMVGSSCDKQITVITMATKQKTAIALPSTLKPDDVGQMGDVRFSLDGKRVAFSMARADPSNEQGWLAITDDLSGSSRLLATAPAGAFYSLMGWLDGSHLVVAVHNLNSGSGAIDSLQIMPTDGSKPIDLGQGSIFVAFVP